MSRISKRFAALKEAKTKAFIPFITAGFPSSDLFSQILEGLPKSGADIIEIGMPFSDPMADGPAIEAANLHAFAQGITLRKILTLVQKFRETDATTPIVLMGYVNPVLAYGVKAFMKDAESAGVDGVIIADLPPEEDAEFRVPASMHAIDLIRLLAPTTDAKRLPTLLNNASGFLYYVSVTGITGGKQANAATVKAALDAIRPHTSLPLAVGFGISTPEQAHAIAEVADAAVVGSAIIKTISSHVRDDGTAHPDLIKKTLAFVETLAQAIHKS